MQSSAIERIIENDRKAREVVAAAEKHRKDTAANIAQKKAEMEEALKKELSDSSKKALEQSEKLGISQTEEYRKNAGMICTAMEALYKNKKSEWVDTYTERIIKSEL
ncbi:MAG: hypothetical protein E7578_06155 [Ruminococcaceae bacterium]|nr:hypothetical protein [Oscillospiraceae bacterium]